MCYSIPGKVIEISDKRVTVDYFGEKKQAYNEFVPISVGDYIYAQGGFIINKVSEDEAKETLKAWEEVFFKLKSVDLRLSRTGKGLYKTANALRQRHLGNSCCVHGIIEFSNFCRQNCIYCGIRNGNKKITRYRMTTEKILETAENAVNSMGFKALVLQGGEDLFYTDEMLCEIITKMRERFPALLFVSFGERLLETYEKAYQAGARGALLRFETSNPSLYGKLKPGQELSTRVNLIKSLYGMGYLIVTGALVGIPGQTEEDRMNDINLAKDLKAEMYSFGPFIPHEETPLKGSAKPNIDIVLNTIAQARIMDPASKIVATTALETLDRENGAKQALMAGANSLMVNVTPKEYSKYYEIYPDRAGIDLDVESQIKKVVSLLHSLGRAPTDLGANPSDLTEGRI